ncbi:DUF6624 domain-containing protein [Hymenobacter sp. BT770]|uniref:DUF6624 domain-containing protein n=1 Tax=Hymenobacter sp. BT770 TaxID=2886942 RepID=UPI001D10BA2D|nr:DUF6624 domain-containing protein [Hymenobacter sp. BT770]
MVVLPLLLAGCATTLTATKKSQLQAELAQMAQVDQIAAYIPQGKYQQYPPKRWESFKDSVFTSNKERVERLFKRYGFLGFNQVGPDGSTHFWLLVQHCDKYPAFQRAVLPAMNREVKKGNAKPSDYALLYDRVQVNAGLKQLFGTQVTYEVATTGRAIPKIGLLDSANVDQRRKAYQLGPLKDYLNMMTSMHYEMNKARYEKKGVLKPNLY